MVRRFLVPLAVVLFLLVGALPAAAHVTVDPTAVTPGSYAVLTFRVPNESAKASTVGVTLTIPQDHPFASVSVLKQPGWTSTVTKTKLATPLTDDDNLTITDAVSQVSWKADATAKIALGEFAEFTVDVGPIPDDVATLPLPVIQTYDDGTVVNWNEPTPAGGDEPEHPEPTLRVGAAAPVSAESGATVTVTATTPATAQAAAARADNAARILAVVATLIGALALLVGALAVRRRRSRSPG